MSIKMKKNVFFLLLFSLITLSLVSCNKNSSSGEIDKSSNIAESTKSNTSHNNYSKLIEIEDAINEDVKVSSESLQESLNDVFSSVGDSYDDYKKNVQKIEDWYTLTQTESEKLYSRITANCTAYYKLIVNTVDLKDYKSWNSAMDDCYDIWNDAMDDYYDTWDDLYDDIYDKYDKLLNDAYNEVSYAEASDAWSNMYTTYSDGWSVMYSIYSNAWSTLYSNHSTVWSGLYNNNTNIDLLLQEAAQERIENNEDKPRETETPEVEDSTKNNPDTPSTNNIRSEFKEAMDSYEKFFDEYTEFMKSFAESGDSLSMLTDYMEFLDQYTETMEAMGELGEEDMSTEEAAYYLEVTTRINQKLFNSIS